MVRNVFNAVSYRLILTQVFTVRKRQEKKDSQGDTRDHMLGHAEMGRCITQHEWGEPYLKTCEGTGDWSLVLKLENHSLCQIDTTGLNWFTSNPPSPPPHNT